MKEIWSYLIWNGLPVQFDWRLYVFLLLTETARGWVPAGTLALKLVWDRNKGLESEEILTLRTIESPLYIEVGDVGVVVWHTCGSAVTNSLGIVTVERVLRETWMRRYRRLNGSQFAPSTPLTGGEGVLWIILTDVGSEYLISARK